MWVYEFHSEILEKLQNSLMWSHEDLLILSIYHNVRYRIFYFNCIYEHIKDPRRKAEPLRSDVQGQTLHSMPGLHLSGSAALPKVHVANHPTNNKKVHSKESKWGDKFNSPFKVAAQSRWGWERVQDIVELSKVSPENERKELEEYKWKKGREDHDYQ